MGAKALTSLLMNVFVFDIETVPDVEGARRFYGLEGLDDAAVAEIMFSKRRQETGGGEFLRLHLHRIAAISVALRSQDRFKVWSLGDPASPEEELIQRFFDGIEKFVPTLVSWNGSAFDLPVIHYRALLHGIGGARYWEIGEKEQSFRWNNYLNRYHQRHLDLMDVLSGYQTRAVAPLDEIATLLGFPGKMGMSGAKVWDLFQSGEFEAIRNYCETDVLNTYLVFLRFELIRGQLEKAAYQQECQRVREVIGAEDKAHFSEFLALWNI